MDDLQQAHHELDRLQGIITRHEDHMYVLRGWLIVLIGSLLAAYYTANIDLNEDVLRTALLAITLIFLFLEIQHVNLIDAVVERITVIENSIAESRGPEGRFIDGWYDGPKVNESCREGARRWWPRGGMTYILNQPFYFVVIAIIVLTTISLPPKAPSTQSASPGESSIRE